MSVGPLSRPPAAGKIEYFKRDGRAGGGFGGVRGTEAGRPHLAPAARYGGAHGPCSVSHPGTAGRGQGKCHVSPRVPYRPPAMSA